MAKPSERVRKILRQPMRDRKKGAAGMPWHVEANHADCDGYAVVKNDGGDVEGCHDSEEEANAQMKALYASERKARVRRSVRGAAVKTKKPMEAVAFQAVLMVLDTPTRDGRIFATDGISLGQVPLPLQAMERVPENGGHGGAVVIGRIDSMKIDDRRVLGTGVLLPGLSDEAARLVALVRSGVLRFISVDGGSYEVEEEVLARSDEGEPAGVRLRFTNFEVAGATILALPAFSQAVVWLDGSAPPPEAGLTLPAAELDTGDRINDEDLVSWLAAASVPALPPVSWFADPHLNAPTPLRITDDGHIFGHAATWGVCHTGLPGCTTAPHSAASYAYFTTGHTRVSTPDGPGEIPTGVLTLGTGHADRFASPAHTAEHYEDTGCAAADVVAGEDEHGIWVAGALRPDVSEEQLRALRGASPSGDWRRIGTGLELVAVLMVNVPGFPVVRASGAFDGDEQLSLVGAGVVVGPTVDRPGSVVPSYRPEAVIVASRRRRAALLDQRVRSAALDASLRRARKLREGSLPSPPTGD